MPPLDVLEKLRKDVRNAIGALESFLKSLEEISRLGD